MAAHILRDGSCLIVYGPHIGIDVNGTIGLANRRGKTDCDACCGSATAAAAALSSIRSGTVQYSDLQFSATEYQQQYVAKELIPHADRIAKAENPTVELPFAVFDAQKQMMNEMVGNGASLVPKYIALLGGIQINTLAGTSDYFLPLSFEFRDNKNEVISDLLTTDLL